METKLAKEWRDAFGTFPVDAADIMANPRTRKAFADAMPWPVEHLTGHYVGHNIARLMGDAAVKCHTPQRLAQKWSLKS